MRTGTLIVAVVATGVLIAGWMMYRNYKRRERDIQDAIARNQ